MPVEHPHLRNIQTRAYELLQYRLQDLSLRTGLNLSKPTFVCMRPTMRCNARCRHCDIYRLPNETELDRDTWCTILDKLRRWLGPGAPLTVTGGELLLRRDALDILEHATRHRFGLYVLSNGWLLTPERIERLLGMDPRVVQVSLDGTELETHDYLRGMQGFGARVQTALTDIADAKRRTGAETTVVLACVVFKQNLDELASVVRWAAETGIDAVKFQPIEQTYGEEADARWFERSELWPSDVERAEAAIRGLIELKRSGYPIQNTIESLKFFIRYFRDPSAHQEKIVSHDQHFENRWCRSAVADFDIGPNGDVKLCYKMDPIGNVVDEDPRDIWNRRVKCWSVPCGLMAG